MWCMCLVRQFYAMIQTLVSFQAMENSLIRITGAIKSKTAHLLTPFLEKRPLICDNQTASMLTD